MRRFMVVVAVLAALSGWAGAQQDVATMAIDQQVAILKSYIRQRVATMGPAEKQQVKAALLELAGEL